MQTFDDIRFGPPRDHRGWGYYINRPAHGLDGTYKFAIVQRALTATERSDIEASGTFGVCLDGWDGTHIDLDVSLWPRLPCIQVLAPDRSIDFNPLARREDIQSLYINAGPRSVVPIEWACSGLIGLAGDETLCFRVAQSKPRLKNMMLLAARCLDLEGMPLLPQLQTLEVRESRRMTSLRGIENAPAISSLSLLHMPQLVSFAGVEKLTLLRQLHVVGCRKISDIEPLSGIASLEHVSLDRIGSVDSLRSLGRLINLRSLALPELKATDIDFSWLSEMHMLEELLLPIKLRRHVPEDIVRRLSLD